MDFITAGSLCIALLLAAMAVGLQIGLAFLLSGFITSTLLLGFNTSVTLMGQAVYFSVATPTWVCIPLFILMGSFAAIGGFARRAYDGVNALSRRLPGSLGITTCFGCAVFGAISGSSIATTAIFGKMALPEMNRLGYDRSFSVGCIAAAGTFASMIPPSMMMIIYALFTQQSVAKLFAAGIIPGLFSALIYAAFIVYRTKKNPAMAPGSDTAEAPLTLKQKWVEAWRMWPVAAIAFVVFGGIYSGLFTPTEAAAAGALITLVFGWGLGSFRSLGGIVLSMKESANTTAMLFLINVGALFYSRVLAVTRIPTELTMYLVNMEIPATFILIGVLAIMFLLGMIMVPVGIYALVLPIVFPIIVKLGYDPIWFGVICLKITEIGAITPPVGLNVYAMKGVIPREMGISLEDIFKGIWPFLLCDIVTLTILLALPGLSTWLPELLLG